MLLLEVMQLAIETISFSNSLRNKGINECVIDQDNKLLEIIINDQKVSSRIERELEKTIENLRKNLDHHITSIGTKEEIIYNISKQFLKIRSITSDNPQSETLMKKSGIPDITKNIHPLEWSNLLWKKYVKLRDKVKTVMPELWKPLEFTLAVKSTLYIQDITLPFIGIILGPPSSVKTLTIELFRNCENTFYTDNFSAKSFVSHNTTIARDKLEECDLLPKIKHKLFLTPELSPTFSKRYEDLTEVMGIITRIADGHGYESDTGAQGHRGYSGEYMFTWVGAAVDVPQKVHRLLGTLGPKLYFLRLQAKKNLDEDNYLRRMKNGDRFKDIFNEIKDILLEYIECFDNYTLSLNTGSETQQLSVQKESESKTVPKGIKVTWNTSDDKEEALRIIIRLARLLSRFRGVIPTWETKDSQGSDYAYTFATIEEPDRAITQLKNLARGHALSNGRFYITMEDIPLVVNVALSTASRERVMIFDHLLKNNGLTDTPRIVEDLNTSKPTALRTMTEFTALGIVDKIILGDDYTGDVESYSKFDRTNALIQVRLKPEFDWFLSNEFQSLRDSHKPDNHQDYTKNCNRINDQIVQTSAFESSV